MKQGKQAVDFGAIAHGLHAALECIEDKDGVSHTCTHPNFTVVTNFHLELNFLTEPANEVDRSRSLLCTSLGFYDLTAEPDREVFAEATFELAKECFASVPGLLVKG